jgi:hypothetical protein
MDFRIVVIVCLVLMTVFAQADTRQAVCYLTSGAGVNKCEDEAISRGPFGHVFRLLVADKTTVSTCTGFLLKQWTHSGLILLTAGHCLKDAEMLKIIVPGSRQENRIQFDGTPDAFFHSNTMTVPPHVGPYKETNPQDVALSTAYSASDWGFVWISQNAQSTLFFPNYEGKTYEALHRAMTDRNQAIDLNLVNQDVLETVESAGYPKQTPPDAHGNPLPPGMYRTSSVSGQIVSDSNDQLLWMYWDTTKGQSGSPVWIGGVDPARLTDRKAIAIVTGKLLGLEGGVARLITMKLLAEIQMLFYKHCEKQTAKWRKNNKC